MLMKVLYQSFILLCVLLFAFYAGSSANETESPAISKIVLACPEETPPFFFLDRDGQQKGWHLDFWRLWSLRTGIQTECRSGSWKELHNELRQGTIDAHAGLLYNKDQDSFLDYSDAVIILRINFFHHRQIFGLNSLEDLRGFRIGVVANTQLEAFLLERLPESSLARYPSFSLLLDAVENEEILVFVAEEGNALWHLKERGLWEQFTFDPRSPVLTQPLFAAVWEGNTRVRALINQGMQQIVPAERAALEKKWFGVFSGKVTDNLVVAMYQNFPPYSSFNAEGEAAGILADIWRLWAEKTGAAIYFRLSDWQDTLDAVQRGEADIHSGLAFTEERALWLDYSQPLCEISFDIFFPQSQGEISTLEELHGESVGLTRGIYQEKMLRFDYPDIQFIAFDSIEAMIYAARKGTIRAFISETLSGNMNLQRLGVSGEFGNTQKRMFKKRLHGAVHQGRSELLALLDEGFNQISRQELTTIEQRWVADAARRKTPSGIPHIRFTTAEQAWLQAGHHVRVWGIDWPPYLLMEKKVQGIAQEYFQRISESTGIEFTFVREGTFGEALEAMQKRDYTRFDAIFALKRTSEREQFLAFSQDYLTPPWVIFTRTDSAFISGIQDLAGKTVVVPRKFVMHDLLAQNYPQLKLLLVDTVYEAVEALATGQADAYIENLVVVSYLIQQQGYNNIKIAAPTPFGKHNHAVGVRDDWPELASILDKALDAITEEEHAAIQNHWLTVRYEHGLRQQDLWKWGLRVLGGTILLLVPFLYWNRRLQREILERKQAEQALKESEEALQELVYIASHDLQTPIVSLVGYAANILKRHAQYLDAKGVYAVQRLKANAERLHTLVLGLLDLSRLNTVKNPYQRIASEEIVRNILSDLALKVSENGATVTIFPMPALYGDIPRLSSVFRNLLTNALNYGATDIVVGYRQNAYFIQDNGIGIAPRHLEKIFTAGERLQNIKVDGVGMGLTFCKKVISQHKGKIWAESEGEGKGATFYFALRASNDAGGLSRLTPHHE